MLEADTFFFIIGKCFIVEGVRLVERQMDTLCCYGLDEGKVLGGVVHVGAQLNIFNTYLPVGVLNVFVYLNVEGA